MAQLRSAFPSDAFASEALLAPIRPEDWDAKRQRPLESNLKQSLCFCEFVVHLSMAQTRHCDSGLSIGFWFWSPIAIAMVSLSNDTRTDSTSESSTPHPGLENMLWMHVYFQSAP